MRASWKTTTGWPQYRRDQHWTTTLSQANSKKKTTHSLMWKKTSETLKILQYNIRNGRSNVMIPLLADELTHSYDVLAIQEPWKNDRGPVPTTYNPRNSGFHVVYQPAANNRVCFYVNKNISPDSWTAAFPSPDIAVLHLTVASGAAKKDLRIINVYNPSPTS